MTVAPEDCTPSRPCDWCIEQLRKRAAEAVAALAAAEESTR